MEESGLPEFDLAIIGAGSVGIAATHLLRRRDIDNIMVLKRSNDFGRTWSDDHGPGLALWTSPTPGISSRSPAVPV